MATTNSQRATRSIEEDLHAQHESAKRLLTGEPSTKRMLEMVVETVRTTISECDGAGILLTSLQGEERAATDEQVEFCETRQTELGEGPALEGLDFGGDLVSVIDLATETRWPTWTREVARRSGVRSVLSLPLSTTVTEPDQGHGHGRRQSRLTLYAYRAGAFTPATQRAAAGFAAIAAAALEAAEVSEELRGSIESHVLIGQAQGIIMERFNTSPDRALLMLQQISRDSNLLIQELARETITIRTFPNA